MLRVACLVLLASACGRVGFESARQGAGDAPPACTQPGTHDEDGDAVTDACDVCPHVADDQADGDGDRVGDACDPEPAIARQRIVLFDPFTSLDPGWEVAVEARVENDELVIGKLGTSQGGVLQRSLIAAHDLFVVAGGAGPAGAPGPHMFSMSTVPATPPGGFYCELYDGGTGTTLFFTVTYDNMTYMHPAGVPIGALANGAGTFAYEIGPVDARCTATWGGVDGVATAPRPTDLPPERLIIYAENVVVRLRYFVQIRTEP